MEILLPEKFSETAAIDGFDDYYYFPTNLSQDYYQVDPLDLCKITRPASPVAQSLCIAMAIVGILFNFCVIYVIAILKEYKKSRFYWLFLHIMVANVLFLLFVFMQMTNELQETWVMGYVLCKIGEASLFATHEAGVAFLMIANVYGILCHLRAIYCRLPTIPWSPGELLKSVLILFFVWFPCTLMNLPLYKYTTINECGQCAQQFPIGVDELCPMLGLNKTSCADMVKFILDEHTNISSVWKDELSSGDFLDYPDEFENFEKDQQILDNLTTMAGLTACKYEEPKSFFVWLYLTFALFFATPLPIFIVFISLWLYGLLKREKKTTTINGKNQESALGMIVALDLLFIFCWTPWNAVHMKKAVSGIQGTSGHDCAALINYSRLSAITYNAIMPFIYIGLTSRFRARFVTSLATGFHVCLRKTWKKRERRMTAESNEIRTMTSTCDVDEKQNGVVGEERADISLEKVESLPSTDV